MSSHARKTDAADVKVHKNNGTRRADAKRANAAALDDKPNNDDEGSKSSDGKSSPSRDKLNASPSLANTDTSGGPVPATTAHKTPNRERDRATDRSHAMPGPIAGPMGPMSGPPGFPPHTRHPYMPGMPGQLPQGPTPTLNQLLQNNPRMPNFMPNPADPQYNWSGQYPPPPPGHHMQHPYAMSGPPPGAPGGPNAPPPHHQFHHMPPTGNSDGQSAASGPGSNESTASKSSSRSMSPAAQNTARPPDGPSRHVPSPGASTAPGGSNTGFPGGPPSHLGYKMPPQSAPAQGAAPSTSAPSHPNYMSNVQGYPSTGQGTMQYNNPNTGYPSAGQTTAPVGSNNVNSQYGPGRPFPGHPPPAWTTSPGPPGPGQGPGGKPTQNQQPVSQAGSPPTATPPHLTPGPGNKPPHFIKMHLQHKLGYGANMSGQSPPQMYHNPSAPSNIHHQMGPQQQPMGPPMSGQMGHMGPPGNMAPPAIGHDTYNSAPMPPPSSMPMMESRESSDDGSGSNHPPTHMGYGAGATTVTTIVTTGPDGTPIDEGSQQSTLSNASIASGEDPQCTPKSRKNDLSGHYSHPATPQSTAPSPGAASMNSMHPDEYEIHSPGWSRTPASPVFNAHPTTNQPETPYRYKKSDSMIKLFEMDNHPERREFLDKLISFMEERRTPISACPTISKQPLDLFRLYLYVKERGGFVEVCKMSKVTKNKIWKDISGMLGIGASSSAAYTLRKHYIKHLFAFECRFDRGGVDPAPIISSLETSSKKKNAKTAPVSSPGSSNSQDAFSNVSSVPMDGYNPYGYSNQTEYPSNQIQRPSSQGNASSPNTAMSNQSQSNDNISLSNPFDDGASGSANRYGPPNPAPGAPQQQQQQQQHQPYMGGRPAHNYPGQQPGNASGYQYPAGNMMEHYPNFPGPAYSPSPKPYSYPEGERPPYPASSSAPSNTTTTGATPPAAPSNDLLPLSVEQMNRTYLPPSATNYPPPRPGYSPAPQQTPATTPPSTPNPPGQGEFYKNESTYSGNTQPLPPSSTAFGNGKSMPPPAQQPRRHPDFAKDPQYMYGQQKSQIYGWPNNQYRGQYGPNQTPPQNWPMSQTPPRTINSTPQSGPPPPMGVGSASNPGPNAMMWQGPPNDRYPGPMANQPANYPPSQAGQAWNQNAQMGPNRQMMPRPMFRPDGKYPMPPPGAMKGPMMSAYGQTSQPRRDITFPPESVEATQMVFTKRRRLVRPDVAPVDPWRIVMSLRSGQLAESTWAIDTLNVLLYDDTSVSYFSLKNMHGFLDTLLEYYQAILQHMFEPKTDEWRRADDETHDDLGPGPDVPGERVLVLKNVTNYTSMSRKGACVRVVDDGDLFVSDRRKAWDRERGDNVDVCRVPNTHGWTFPYGEVSRSTDHIVGTFGADNHTRFFPHVDDDKRRDGHSDTNEPVKTEIKAELCADEPPNVTDNAMDEAAVTDGPLTDDPIPDNTSTNDKSNHKLELNAPDKPEVLDVVVLGLPTDDQATPRQVSLKISDPAGVLKRKNVHDYEDEPIARDEPSLNLLSETHEFVAHRCVTLSNILRSLTFIPGNEPEMAENVTWMALVGKLLMYEHKHAPRSCQTRNYDRGDDVDVGDSCSSLAGEDHWWWDVLKQIREDALVSLSNVAGFINLAKQPEIIARPIADGLLHWAVCRSAEAQDSFKGPHPCTSPSAQRLSLETMGKLCVTPDNTDLILNTPPQNRLETLVGLLVGLLNTEEEQVMREFAVNLLYYFTTASSKFSSYLSANSMAVSSLIAFLETAEKNAMTYASQHGLTSLRDNPEMMGTTLDMLRRVAITTMNILTRMPASNTWTTYEARMLNLTMSRIFDPSAAKIICEILRSTSMGNRSCA